MFYMCIAFFSFVLHMTNEIQVCGHRWINNKTYPSTPKNEYDYHITGACYWSQTNENVTSELLPITGIQSNNNNNKINFNCFLKFLLIISI